MSLLQLAWSMRRLRPNSVSSGCTDMQFEAREQSPHPWQTAGLMTTRFEAAATCPRLRLLRFSVAQICT
jgi:hypothetical protein